ncbi:hypothetical protein ACFLRZ_01485 [Bacteroidota bacterium]
MPKALYLFKLLIIIFLITFFSTQCKTNKSLSNINLQKGRLILSPIIDQEYIYQDAETFTITDAVVIDKILHLNLSYSGGSGTHQFELIWNGRYLKTHPIQIPLFIKHTVQNEDSNEEKQISLKYDVSGILPSNEDLVYLKINGFDNKVECKIK